MSRNGDSNTQATEFLENFARLFKNLGLKLPKNGYNELIAKWVMMMESIEMRLARIEAMLPLLIADVEYVKNKFDDVLVKYAEIEGRCKVTKPWLRGLITLLTQLAVPLCSGLVGAMMALIVRGA